MKQKNVLGTELEVCGLDPKTGFFRDGCCNTDSRDRGSHTVLFGYLCFTSSTRQPTYLCCYLVE